MPPVIAFDPMPSTAATGAGAPMRAAGVRAGPWLFLTGHHAADRKHGTYAAVTGNPAMPLHGQHRYRREGDAVLGRFGELLEQHGSGFDYGARLDQYYPTWRAVDPYHRARKAVFRSFIPPSTSVLMEELLVPACSIDVSLIAVARDSGMTPRPVTADDVPVPEFSAFVPALVAGDYVFVAGQMANAESMDGLDPRASKPKTALWNGTEIRLQTEFLIKSRLEPALVAGGSSLKNAIKAQAYLSDMADMPNFLDVWNAHFADAPCALTVVPASGFGFTDGIIEINIFGLRDSGATAKQVIDVDLPRGMALGPAAVRAGDLVCLSGLLAADDDGPVVAPARVRDLRYLGAGAFEQTQVILETAARICEQAGTRLERVLRAQHFLTSLYDFPATQSAWASVLEDVPIPSGAVRVPAPLPVPDCTVMLDMWVFAA
jgi:enamine deaminase RidA (YjgF/YER057c/UK114 family)